MVKATVIEKRMQTPSKETVTVLLIRAGILVNFSFQANFEFRGKSSIESLNLCLCLATLALNLSGQLCFRHLSA